MNSASQSQPLNLEEPPTVRRYRYTHPKTASPTHLTRMSHVGAGKAASSKEQTGLRYPSNGKTIYHRPLNRTKTAELSQAAFAYLFSEMVIYAQRRVTGIQELEKR
jgi:hypothetical protein